MDIVVPKKLLTEARQHVLARQDVETHCFFFGGYLPERILVGRVWKTPDEMYNHRSASRIELKRQYVIEALEYARWNNFAIVDVHSHPWSNRTHFSGTDDEWGLKNAKWVQKKSEEGHFPRVPWAMVVVAKSDVTAQAYDYVQGQLVPALVRTPTSFTSEDISLSPRDDQMYNRQLKLWGIAGQARLGEVRVAIVGLGGLGLLISEQLSRIGIRKFTLIDGDKVEESNLNRLTGFYAEHTGMFKVNVAAMNIRRVAGQKTEVNLLREFLTSETMEVLEGHDLIVGGVDREGPRLLMNEASVRYLIPYLDTGSGIRASEGRVTQMGGQVRSVIPGTTPCLQCYAKGLDPFEAAVDLMTEQDRNLRRTLGYVEGTDLSPEPSVIPLNGIIASLCTQEIAKLITGFHEFHTYVHYDSLKNELQLPIRAIALEPEKSCPICGIGGLLGIGKNEKQTYVTESELKALGRMHGDSQASGVRRFVLVHPDVAVRRNQALMAYAGYRPNIPKLAVLY